MVKAWQQKKKGVGGGEGETRKNLVFIIQHKRNYVNI